MDCGGSSSTFGGLPPQPQSAPGAARECAVPQQQEVLFHPRRRELLLQFFLQPIRSLPRLAGGSACKADGGARSGERRRQLPRALPRALYSLYTRQGRAGRPPAPESHRWGLLVVVKESRRSPFPMYKIELLETTVGDNESLEILSIQI
eukprot:bmy_08087T0